MAILELYLSIKIRSDEEISEYNKDLYQLEKDSMDGIDGYNIIDMVKKTIEQLMAMRHDTLGSNIDKANIDVDEKFLGKHDIKKNQFKESQVLNTQEMGEQLQRSLNLKDHSDTQSILEM